MAHPGDSARNQAPTRRGEDETGCGDETKQNEALGERLTRLSQASLRINKSLDYPTGLQRVLDSARSLELLSFRSTPDGWSPTISCGERYGAGMLPRVCG